MCIICYVPQGTKLSQSEVSDMWDCNPHGAGYTYYDGREDKWIMKKGFMRKDEILEALDEEGFIDSKSHSNIVLHFRYATHGEIVEELTHPFLLSLSDRKAYVFHNGVFETQSSSQSSGILLKEDESDTSAFTRLLSSLELTKEQLFCLLKDGGLLSKLIDASRLAITIDGMDEPYLVGEFKKHAGKIVSNTRPF